MCLEIPSSSSSHRRRIDDHRAPRPIEYRRSQRNNTSVRAPRNNNRPRPAVVDPRSPGRGYDGYDRGDFSWQAMAGDIQRQIQYDHDRATRLRPRDVDDWARSVGWAQHSNNNGGGSSRRRSRR